jgi:enamine deaminase RidA (YjgF/YER057c/UK114 family)
MLRALEHVTSPDLFRPPGYAHAVVSRAPVTVWTAGGVPIDRDGALVGAGDVRAQARQVLANLTVALRAAGADPSLVVRTTVYVVGSRADLSAVWEVVQDSPYAPAASTLLGVSVLGYEGQLVEVEATAVVR